jgi:hypothetical protein
LSEEDRLLQSVALADQHVLSRDEVNQGIKEALHEVRLRNARNWATLAKSGEANLLLGAIKASSQEQYASNKNRVIKAGHRWDHDGLYDYFTDEKVATKLWLLLNS